MPSPCAVGEETGHAAREDLRFVNGHDTGGGRTMRVWFVLRLRSKGLLVHSGL